MRSSGRTGSRWWWERLTVADPAAPLPVETFGRRLADVFARFGQFCVGIDPHPYLLDDWGLPQSALGVREFGLRVVDATVGSAGIIKPQVAFFERFGSAGFAALETVIVAARSAGLLVIADAKRGDLGTSVDAYGQAWLSPGAALESDALTISGYLGVGSIEAPMRLAELHNKGLFLLAATSNPEGRFLQTAKISAGTRVGMTVASSIVEDVGVWNRDQGASGIGSIGVVMGATVDFAEFGIDLDSMASDPATPVLAPGFGHQGAALGDLESRYGAIAPYTIVSASRSILESGTGGVAEAIRAQSAEVFACRA